MKPLFSLMVIILLVFSPTVCTVADSTIFSHPQANRLVTTSEISMPFEVKRLSEESTESISKQARTPVISESTPDIAEDGIVVRVVESPKIDTILTLLAVIISAIAILLSAFSLVFSAKLQMKHNRDEVRPVIAIHLDKTNMSIKIKNHGIGPAIFKSIIWKNVKSNVSAYSIEKLLGEKWSKLNLGSSFSIYTKPFVGASDDPDILAPQEELFFINVGRDNPMTLDKKRALGKTFRDVEVCLTYTDLYGREKWTLTKNLSWIAK